MALVFVCVACAPRVDIDIPFDPGSESVLFAVERADAPDAPALYALERGSVVNFDLSTDTEQRLTALLYDRALDALELRPGAIEEAAPGAPSRMIPAATKLYTSSVIDGEVAAWTPAQSISERLMRFALPASAIVDPCAPERPTCPVDQVGTASVSVRGLSACALGADHALWCWGANDSAHLGTGDVSDRNSPELIAPNVKWRSVSISDKGTCGVAGDGRLFCWGENTFGELGTGTTSASLADVPTPVGTDRDWAIVAHGYAFACALKRDRSLWCWGFNSSSNLGLGDNRMRTSPERVAPGVEWSSIALGSAGGCAIDIAGALSCWGGNRKGRLATGDRNPRSRPTKLEDGSTWRSIATWEHSCGIKSDGSLWCWGSNDEGELGLGDRGEGTERLRPERVGDLSSWTEVAIGPRSTCALQDDGSLWCWGAFVDLMSACSPASSTVPARIAPEITWRTIAVASAAAPSIASRCGIDVDGALWCWGDNSRTQLALGDAEPRAVPAGVCFPQH